MTNYAINPLDGRYVGKTAELGPYFSEWALMKYRVLVECEFLIFLASSNTVGLKKIKESDVKVIRNLYQNFSDASYQKIKKHESVTNHDVKAVEYFIKDELKKHTSLKSAIPWIHFGLTSEDTNNISYALMLSHGLSEVITTEIETIGKMLRTYSQALANLPMLSRTHGQSASPTTLGKEFAVFHARLLRQIAQIKKIKILAKCNGATGNYNAFVAAYPKVSWQNFSKGFISHIAKITNAKLEVNLVTTQIESHDTYAELFDTLRRVNMVLIDCSQDMWRYISDGYLIQKPKTGEVGSSTMPHKVNPIDFENSEGNLGLANALATFFSTKLPVSRLQRDLSDSTVERTFGTFFGHSLLGYTSLQKGLSKISPNREKILADLNAHPEVLAEAIQTILRREGIEDAYEALKKVSRGKETTLKDFQEFIQTLSVSPLVKKELLRLTPESYTGLASSIAKKA